MPHALVVEDEPVEREALARIVGAQGFSVASAGTIEEARRLFKAQPAGLILSDLVLPDGSGLDLLDEVRESGGAEFILITGHSSVETAVQALRRGATDYVVKPTDPAHLERILASALRALKMRGEIGSLRNKLRELGHFGQLDGSSSAMQKVYDFLGRVGPTEVSVLITGESGSGKELTAQTIHDLSPRRDGPMLALNCGAVPANIIESELFGHERGSFTGALQRHEGYFSRANGGTLFLDEIAEMQYDLQVKLLRVLETGKLTRIGGEREVAVDVRIIAATNRDVKAAVAAGKLREDLYYRLKVMSVYLPPLRERGDDVIELAELFLRKVNEKNGTSKRFDTAALDRLKAHSWPGNVRELKNVVQSAAIMADDRILPHHLALGDAEVAAGPAMAAAAPQASAGKIIVEVGTSTVEDTERRLVMATLEACGNNKTRAAKQLGLNLKTLYNRMKAWESLSKP
ncbi:MAG: sigma-54 dependent transcriptional regulator [Planctomycetes bacterium]|nr:sigma-54 dependent transcriptional regulator [Planctomycetota bacterium]